jgi:hypothetical protein
MVKPVFILILILLCAIGSAQEHPVLLPRPQQIKYGKDQLRIADLSIYLPAQSTQEDIFNAGELSASINSRTGINVAVTHEKKGKQIIITNGNLPSLPGLDETTGPEGRESYTIKIDGKGIRIDGKSSAAAMARFDHEIQYWQKIQIMGMESTRIEVNPEDPLPDFYKTFDLKKDY